jgi:cyanophycinase
LGLRLTASEPASTPAQARDADVRVPPGPGPIALVGSGEYLPVLEHVERALIAGRPPRYVQLATAAAPEGSASLARWHRLGAAAAERLGVQQVVVPVGDRNDAEDPANAGLVEGAGLVYLSGGNPAYLAQTLRDTRVWHAIVDAWRAGAAVAGCSAGAMAMSASFPDIRRPWRPAMPGLGLVPMVEVLPHFDRFTSRLPDLAVRRVAGARPGVQVVGIDEDTALVGGLGNADDVGRWAADPAGPGTGWRVLGRQSVWLLMHDGRVEVPSGDAIVLPR